MYADAGSFEGIGVDRIVHHAHSSKTLVTSMGGKDQLVARVVADAVADVQGYLDDMLHPNQAVRRNRPWPTLADIAVRVFDVFAGDFHQQQRLVVMAWLTLPTARPAKWRHEQEKSEGRNLHPGRELADDYERWLTARLVDVCRSEPGVTEPDAKARLLAGLVRSAHVSVARSRPHDLAGYSDTAVLVVRDARLR